MESKVTPGADCPACIGGHMLGQCRVCKGTGKAPELGSAAELPVEAKPLNPPKSWWVRIDEAEKHGCFDWRDRDLAYSWVDCACGQQDPRIPRQPKGGIDPYAPVDKRLLDLGTRFYEHVRLDRFGYARRCLKSIEIRSAEILHDLGYELPSKPSSESSVEGE